MVKRLAVGLAIGPLLLIGVRHLGAARLDQPLSRGDTITGVLVERALDRVVVMETSGPEYVRQTAVWQKRNDKASAWEVFWSSGEIYDARPESVLQDLNGDGTVDLFEGFAFENLFGATVVFDSAGKPKVVHLDQEMCAAPRLVDRGQHFFIEVKGPGPYPYDHCTDPGLHLTCLEGDEGYWPVVFKIAQFGFRPEAVPDSVLARFGALYRAAAARLDSLIASRTTMVATISYAEMCGEYLLRLKQFADSVAEVRRSPR